MQQAARPTSTLTADQRRLLTTLKGLEEEENWQGVVNLERELLALATTVGGAAAMHGVLVGYMVRQAALRRGGAAEAGARRTWDTAHHG